MAFPQYIVMGMSETQFWDGDPFLAIAYREAYKLKRQLDNEQAWLEGLYNLDAFAVVLANAFSKRGAKQQKYLERPIDIYPLTEEEKQRRLEEENKRMTDALKAMQRSQRSKKKPKKGDNNG